MLLQDREAAEQEINQWRAIRRSEKCRDEFLVAKGFIQGLRSSEILDVPLSDETMEYIEMLLVADGVRLKGDSTV